MFMTEVISTKDSAFQRIEKVLHYVHNHLEHPLAIEDIAAESCWSRWQLQRVFQTHTGKSVAGYVRELKLSRAAEAILDTQERIIDVSTRFGFASEISFSRSFKQQFGQSPREYRSAGVRRGLMQPIQIPENISRLYEGRHRFVEVRVEYLSPLDLVGIKTEINGMFSPTPDFSARVPDIWQKFHQQLVAPLETHKRFIGVIDLNKSNTNTEHLTYWAAVPRTEIAQSDVLDDLLPVKVPQQIYAVIRHRGPVSELPATLLWMLVVWLPESGYRGSEGAELEIYPSGYDRFDDSSEMEYWLPIQKL